MKLIKFISYLLRHGSWKQSRIDFEEERRTILKGLPASITLQISTKKSILRKLVRKSTIASTLFTNLAYAKNASTMNTMLFISDAKQLVYVRILKAASTSMLKEFLRVLDNRFIDLPLSDKQVDALAFYYRKKEIMTHQATFKRFALVRNPFERIVSVYLDLFDPTEHFSYTDYWFGILKQNMNFNEFVKTIYKIPLSWMGPHMAPQYLILKSTGGLDKISCFRIEKDKDAIDSFLKEYSISLPHRNKQKIEYDYRAFYDEESLRIVCELYQEDMRAFHYEDDYTMLLNFVSTVTKI